MKTVTVKLTAKSAAHILKFLDSQRDELREQLEAVEGEISEIKLGFNTIANTGKEGQLTPPILPAAKTIHRKLGWGEPEKLIIKSLKEANGTGLTANQLMKMVGTKTGTTYRILNKLKENKKVSEDSALWSWIV